MPGLRILLHLPAGWRSDQDLYAPRTTWSDRCRGSPKQYGPRSPTLTGSTNRSKSVWYVVVLGTRDCLRAFPVSPGKSPAGWSKDWEQLNATRDSTHRWMKEGAQVIRNKSSRSCLKNYASAVEAEKGRSPERDQTGRHVSTTPVRMGRFNT